MTEKFESARDVIDAVRGVFFAGRYITSNLAEYVFQFKPWLKTKHDSNVVICFRQLSEDNYAKRCAYMAFS